MVKVLIHSCYYVWLLCLYTILLILPFSSVRCSLISLSASAHLSIRDNLAMWDKFASWLVPIVATVYDKTFKEETFPVWQQYSLCREDFRSLPMTIWFSVLITKQENFCGKTFVVSENLQKFPPQMFYCIQYHALLVKLLLVDMGLNCMGTSSKVHTCTASLSWN